MRRAVAHAAARGLIVLVEHQVCKQGDVQRGGRYPDHSRLLQWLSSDGSAPPLERHRVALQVERDGVTVACWVMVGKRRTPRGAPFGERGERESGVGRAEHIDALRHSRLTHATCQQMLSPSSAQPPCAVRVRCGQRRRCSLGGSPLLLYTR